MPRRIAALLLFGTSVAVAAVDDRVVVLLGDSTTVSGESKPGERYADFVRAQLASVPDCADVAVVNAGKGGDTADGALARVDTDVAAYDPDVVAVSFGLNDSIRRKPEEFAANLRRLVEAIRARTRADVILATSTPFDDRHSYAKKEPYAAAGALDRHLDTNYNDAVRTLARDLALPLCDPHRRFEEAFAEAGGDTTALLLPDGVHLTPAANRLMAETIVPLLRDALARRAKSGFPGVLPRPKEYRETGEPLLLAPPGRPVTVRVLGDAPVLQTTRRALAARLESLDASLLTADKPLITIGTAADWPADAPAVEITGLDSPQAYALAVADNGRGHAASIAIRGRDAIGAFYGVQTLLQLIEGGPGGVTVRRATVRDWPTFPFRLFKGQCWYYRDNRMFVEWMDRWKWNRFGSCYTDCRDWRDPPPAYRRMIADLCEVANRRATVEVLQLGNPYVEKSKAIRATVEADADALVAFFEISLEHGSRTLMLCLDDFAFLSDDDKKAFGSLAAANASFVKRFAAKIRTRHPDTRILLCPPPYWLTANQARGYEWAHDYLREFCAAIPKDIDIVWTGRHVTTVRHEAPDIEAYQALIGSERRLFLWDNTLKMPAGWSNTFLMNAFLAACPDVRSSAWPTLAPFVHGEAGINTYSAGEIYTVPLMTAADYLWNPEGYDPHDSLVRALYWMDDNPKVGPRVYRFTNGLHRRLFQARAAFLAKPSAESLEEIRALCTDYERLFGLIAGATKNQNLVETLRPYVRRHTGAVPILTAVLSAAQQPAPQSASALAAAEESFAAFARSLGRDEPSDEQFGVRHQDMEKRDLALIKTLRNTATRATTQP